VTEPTSQVYVPSDPAFGTNDLSQEAPNSVSGPDHLTNGAFTFASALQITGAPRSWSAPVANDAFDIGFRQHIDADEPLRTGSYGTTLTFTLSTTNP
jgi:hypothetical protein